METGRTVQLEPEQYKDLIDEREAAVYLGYGGQMPDSGMRKEFGRCADMLVMAMQPRYRFAPVRLLREESNGNLLADFGKERLVLPGQAIGAHLGKEGLAVAACLTLGGRVDALIDALQKQSMLDALLTDALANAAVERLRMRLEQDAGKTLELSVGWLFGIGYEDFPITLQDDFLRCMSAGEGIGLSVSAKGILSPLKSVTGFLNVMGEVQEGEKRCSGRCAICPRHEECRFFQGVH